MDHQYVNLDRQYQVSGLNVIYLRTGNVSVCVLPIQALPGLYRYGYAMPFYNVSLAVRAIVFGTKNQRK